MSEPSGVFREWSKRYWLEYFIALALCVTSVAFLIPLARAAKPGTTRALLAAVPAASILLMALAVLRHFRRIDEFLRRVMVESFAVAGAFACVWTLMYGIFELAGFPRISMWWAWGSMVVVWNAWTFGKWMFWR